MASVSLRQVEGLGRLGLHAERGLERLDAGGEVGVAGARASRCRRLKRLRQAEFQLLQVGASAAGAGCWRSARGRARHASPDGSRAGSRDAQTWPPAYGQLRREHDERRQVPIHRAQAVADPRADARPGERERAGVHAERRL